MSVPPESVIPPPPSEPVVGGPSAEERQWAMFLASVGAGRRDYSAGQHHRAAGDLADQEDTMPFVNDQGKEALNFNITVAIAAIVCWILCFILIGFLLLAVLAIGWLVFVIIGTDPRPTKAPRTATRSRCDW